jgi:hypothetical protein
MGRREGEEKEWKRVKPLQRRGERMRDRRTPHHNMGAQAYSLRQETANDEGG